MQSTLKIFTQHLDLSQNQVETLLSKTLNECLNSPEFQQQLDSLDINLMRETLPTAGEVLAKELPSFYDWLKNELNVERVPDSPEHTTNWVINFVNNQENLTHLVELHRPVPHPALETAIPRLVELFDAVKDWQVKKEWQKAIAILCLPLVVDAREREKYSVAV
ncbi:MAG: hypothetical protein N2235_03240 [Fischerella sp.]|nr:hypothetical protein [Fischerella sp.]